MNTANLLSSEPPRLSKEEADALLQSVRPQIEKLEFDAGDRTLLQQMIEGMGDARGTVRLGFAESLGKIGKPATPLLVDALQNHTNPVVRRAAAKTITLISDPAAIPALVRALLTDEDTVVQCSSVGALANIGAPSVPPLLDILKSPDRPEAAKGLAAWALSFIGSEAKEAVYREISSDSATVRSAVVGAASKIAQENLRRSRDRDSLGSPQRQRIGRALRSCIRPCQRGARTSRSPLRGVARARGRRNPQGWGAGLDETGRSRSLASVAGGLRAGNRRKHQKGDRAGDFSARKNAILSVKFRFREPMIEKIGFMPLPLRRHHGCSCRTSQDRPSRKYRAPNGDNPRIQSSLKF